jgi:hypothetical protein
MPIRPCRRMGRFGVPNNAIGQSASGFVASQCVPFTVVSAANNHAYQIVCRNREATVRACLRFRQFSQQILRLQFEGQEPQLQLP